MPRASRVTSQLQDPVWQPKHLAEGTFLEALLTSIVLVAVAEPGDNKRSLVAVKTHARASWRDVAATRRRLAAQTYR